MNRLAAIVAESLSVPASKLAPGKRTPRHPFGFPGLAGHGSGLARHGTSRKCPTRGLRLGPRGTYQATFRGASVSREAGFRVGWRRCLHRQGGAMGGCVLARESAHGPPGAGEARRRHPFPWSREALTTFASSASPLLCFLCVKRGSPRRDFNAERQRSRGALRTAMCGRMFRWPVVRMNDDPMKTELSFIGNLRKRKRSASVLVRG